MPHPADLRITDFTYELPDARIARHPLAVRDASKLLHYQDGRITDHSFSDLPSLLPADALLLFNNTRVVQARLLFRKESGALIELFCLEPLWPSTEIQIAMQQAGSVEWRCLVGNNKRWKEGVLEMKHQDLQLRAEKVAGDESGQRIKLSWSPETLSFAEVLTAFGEIPLPPYLGRRAEAEDESRYQTVYARFDGAVAAPTAGLHFTDRVFAALDARGIARTELTLHVGAGTFKPVKAETMAGHDMHREEIVVRTALLERLLEQQGPIVPVGTTSLRTLESLYWMGCLLQESDTRLPEPDQFSPYTPDLPQLPTAAALQRLLQWMQARQLTESITYTSILIAPGYRFRLAQGLVTNFHQPQSTLLLLVAAAVGDDWRDIYEHALGHDYRFLSYGDSSLLWFREEIG